MTERTLVLIKPDGVERGLQQEIKERLTATGLSIIAEMALESSYEKADAHYFDLGERKGPDVKREVVEYLASGPIEALVVEGENAIDEVRRIVGVTQPIEADPGTIRADLGLGDSYAKAKEEGRPFKNLIHASDSPESAAYEIKLWFPELA